MILPTVRDARFVTIRRGGTLTEVDHRVLALWAATCAEHVLAHFEAVEPDDSRPRQAIEHIRAWTRKEVSHVAAHELGASAYAIKAARAAAPGCEEHAGRLECAWQREQLPDAIRELVLDDQRLRNDICWSVFADDLGAMSPRA